MVKKRGLGKGLGDLGLNELLGTTSSDVALMVEPSSHSSTSPTQQLTLQTLHVNVLTPGKCQPRLEIPQETLQELADSIRAQGVLQPLLVRKLNLGSNQYEIIAGERRWRAAKLAGLTEVPVIIRDISDQTAVAVALIENIQRRDLNAIEEALALQRLIDEFDMTHQAVADAIGKSRAVVTNLLRLLKLNPQVRKLVESGKLEMGHARALIVLEDRLQTRVAQRIVDRELSVRQTEQFIRRLHNLNQPKNEQLKMDDALQARQKTLSDRLGVKVKIRQNDKDKGCVVIHYKSLAELDGLMNHFKAQS